MYSMMNNPVSTVSGMEKDWRIILNDHLQTAKKPLIVILGPTASGKTAFSVEVARAIGEKNQMMQRKQKMKRNDVIESPDLERHLSSDSSTSSVSSHSSVEIINADSRQFYRHLTIGTAKITPEEMQGIPHHLIDVLDPKAPVTIAWYQKEAATIIDDVLARGTIPMLVGGSMLYISSIIDGLQPPVASDPDLRKRLEEEYEHDGGVSLHAKLADLDPESAQLIPKQNRVYLIRALEIIERSGKKASAQKQTSSCPYDLLIFGMDMPPELLNERINRRMEAMFDAGWIDEVRDLLKRGYTIEDPGMESHGYREIAAALQSGHFDQGSLIKDIAAKTRQYAKRQRTWWRGDRRIHWIKT